MKTNLMRTAYNMIIYEALDFTVGLFDAQGDTISIGLGLPMFIRGMSDTVKAKLKHFGSEGIHPGDVLVTNDAYVTGSHLNHVTFSSPIFHGGRLVGFAACMAHWADIGGTLDGITTDIYSEGLQIPFLKAWRRGVPNEDLLDIIRMNVRLPERALGDLKAQIAAVRTGEKRFIELMDKYGHNAVLGAIQSIFDQSEQAARAAVRHIPNGTYEAESYMDDDGVNLGQPIPIKVRVIVYDEEITVDLSEVSAQVKGFYNSGETAGLSCAGEPRRLAGVVEAFDLCANLAQVDCYLLVIDDHPYFDRDRLSQVDAVVVHVGFGFVGAIRYVPHCGARGLFALIENALDGAQHRVVSVFVHQLDKPFFSGAHGRDLRFEIPQSAFRQANVHADDVEQIFVGNTAPPRF